MFAATLQGNHNVWAEIILVMHALPLALWLGQQLLTKHWHVIHHCTGCLQMFSCCTGCRLTQASSISIIYNKGRIYLASPAVTVHGYSSQPKYNTQCSLSLETYKSLKPAINAEDNTPTCIALWQQCYLGLYQIFYTCINIPPGFNSPVLLLCFSTSCHENQETNFTWCICYVCYVPYIYIYIYRVHDTSS